jgi:putative ABC transport system substrate-binding protein
VPRYFFNVHDGKDLPDNEGVELAGRDAAHREAFHTAGEMLKAADRTFKAVRGGREPSRDHDEPKHKVKPAAVPIACAIQLLLAVTATAETTAPPKRLGILAATICPTSDTAFQWGPLLHNLAERGWVEGQNIIVDCVAAEGHPERVPTLAVELVERRPDVVLAASNTAAVALKQATSTVPIVFSGSDALQGRIVQNLARPEANVTGVSPMAIDLVAKRMELLKELQPRLSRVAVIYWSAVSAISEAMERETGVAAEKLHLMRTMFFPAAAEDYDHIFAHLAANGFDGAYVFSNPLSILNRERIARLALRYG